MMSDKPLFENMDEQEATYAPEELPEGPVVPGAAEGAAEGGAVSGQMGGAVAGAIPGVVGPAITEEAIDENTNVEGEENRGV